MANNPYVNKVVFGNNTVMDISGDTVTPSDVLKGATFHDKSGASQVGTLSLDEFATIDLLKDTVGWTGKNLLPCTNNSSGIFTVKSDKTVVANGTPSTPTDFVYNYHMSIRLPVGTYVLSGCPSGGNNSTTYRIRLGVDSVPHDWGTYVTSDFGDGATFTVEDSTKYYSICCTVYANYAASNITFKPMIRHADIADSTYEPYHASVEQTLRDAEVIEGKNLLKNNAISQTINDVTFTVNGDGTVTANGTASADTVFWLLGSGWGYDDSAELPDTIKANTSYTLTDGLSSPSASKYIRMVLKNSSGTNVYALRSDNAPTGLTPNDLSGLKAATWISISSGTTLSNEVFKPMLRDASISDSAYEPYYIPLKDSKFDRAEQRVLGAKNLWDYSLRSYTLNGATVSLSGNEYTVVTDTQNNSGIYFADTQLRTYCEGKIGANSSAILSLDIKGDSNFSCVVGFSGASAMTLSTSYQHIELPISNVSTMGSVIIYDQDSQNSHTINIKNMMLRLASDTDDTYVPYAMTNKELTDAITPTPSSTLTEKDVVDSVVLANKTDNKVPSLYGMQQWSNNVKKRYFCPTSGTGSIGNNGIGDWPADSWNPTTAEYETWWYNSGFIFVEPVTPVGDENPKNEGWYVPATRGYVPTEDTSIVTGTTYYKDINSDDLDVRILFDNRYETIALGGYRLDTARGLMCIRFANRIIHPELARVAVDITYTRTEINS